MSDEADLSVTDAQAAASDLRERRAAEVRKALDGIYSVQLRTISLVMAIYYTITTVSHLFFLPEAIRMQVVAVSLVALISCIFVHILTRLDKIPAQYSHAALLPPALVGVALVFVHVWLANDPHQLTNGVLVLMAFGFVTLLPLIYIVLTAVATLAFVVTLVAIGGEWTVHYGFMAFAGLLLSILCFLQRYRTLSNVERLLISNRSKSQALAKRARESQRLLAEAEAAAEEARVANEAKGAFLANTSHELRTPLTGVLGMMRLLASSDLSEEQEELVRAAQFSASTLLTLINDILDLAKLEEGKLELHPEAFSPGDLTRRIVDLLRPEAEEKGLELAFHDCCETSPLLMGDSVRIGQILFNLVGNAIKFTDSGRVDVTISLSCNNEAAQPLQFLVEDTGVGFDQSVAERLFERFEQVDGSAVKRQAGTGLGLAICSELAGLMNGQLGATSEPGVGSRFSFDLVLPVAETESAVEPAEPAACCPAPQEERSLAILVAEDNKVNQMLIGRLLTRDHWSVTMVEDGKSAVDAILAQDFDIVFMDVRMPVLDGVDATRAVRAAADSRSATPIVALTANTMPDDILKYRDVGMDGIVGKPIQPDELEQVMDAVLGGAPGAGFDLAKAEEPVDES